MQHQMNVMDVSGHFEIKWDPSNEDEVEVARETFKAMLDKGYRAFHITDADKQGRRMDSFSPAAERLTLVPHFTGG